MENFLSHFIILIAIRKCENIAIQREKKRKEFENALETTNITLKRPIRKKKAAVFRYFDETAIYTAVYTNYRMDRRDGTADK